MSADERSIRKPAAKRTMLLSFTALGVVFGDIGTSPLYAFRECFADRDAIDPTAPDVLGVLSLIFWSLVIVISVKYLAIVLRADNQGEGGILALMELVLPRRGAGRGFILIIGLFGAALLYGDGTITPAISVLSAVEGLSIATSAFDPYVVPITLVVLLLLFLLQRSGTGKVGMLFGPVMTVWFVMLAVTGVISLAGNASVLASINPAHALEFVFRHGKKSLVVIGTVFLVVTGGEALYADIGHFGKMPIRRSWFFFVMPCLLLNYFGQGALVLSHPDYAVNPFYHLVPSWSLYPVVALAAMATIIASQAIISGAFSLTMQAMQLGYLPRFRLRHTSAEQQGQIYVPQLNWLLFFATAAVVIGFRSSGNLAAAYGVAVSTTMAITTVLAFVAMRNRWRWGRLPAIAVSLVFVLIDLAFLVANGLKVFHGGWYPILVGTALYLVMSTWVRGGRSVERRLAKLFLPLSKFVDELDMRTVTSVGGTVIYLTRAPEETPPGFVYNIRINKIVHRRVLFLTVMIESVPHITAPERVRFERLPHGFYRVTARYGFMDRPDVTAVVRIINNNHLKIDLEETTYVISRQSLISREPIGMSRWRDRLYLFLWRNSDQAVRYLNLPPNRVLEMGGQITI